MQPKEWARGPSLADKIQAGESEGPVLPGPGPWGVRLRLLVAVINSWSKSLVSEGSKDQREGETDFEFLDTAIPVPSL